ncbi:SDR family oxidoreductase [Herbaspirillum sp. RTI4]|uniref:NAD-dependent epimerase/dehydratase family protein n=1 Tax=Herbaspirillum sp. RTI4 TaxID=3048640 RepID=UPI002AB50934|nr:SDR family oxidoreductase [Herbaspirillum sp. RTI4]MDY7578795.1 SDR family oxidoreductase [Herbaspirillum sp. RTI4]MEA9982284.1 SDR family oxidoreductase [Herbaspirillum sp. RTI4]
MNKDLQQAVRSKTSRTMIVGNLGYIGPVLAQFLSKNKPDTDLIGFDNAYFSGCFINPFETTEQFLTLQIYDDVRNVKEEHLKDIDNVIYLAAISNDPMGNVYAIPTEQINELAAIQFAALAKKNGAKRFVYASSCSVYGAGGEIAKSEDSALNPLTAYAKSKINAEQQLQSFADQDFFVTCLRFATACGASPRLRLDLVLNDFVASALLKNEIEILSDGTPWRPLIDVEEMSKAILWAIERDDIKAGAYLTVNVGFDEWNYTIKDLAYAVKDVLTTTSVKINPSAAPDKRSYRVDFSLYKSLASDGKPHKSIETTISELINNINESPFRMTDFRNSHLIRLNTLNHLRQKNKLDSSLQWTELRLDTSQ